MADWPLCGRHTELLRLREWIEHGATSGAVVVGAVGVGKTRLAQEVLTVAAGDGYATGQVKGTRSASGLPFGAFAHLLPEVEDVPAPHAHHWADLLRRSARGILKRTGHRRLVLFVDDAHLLDDASATLVHSLAAERSAFILATIRSGEAAPDPVVSLWKDGLAERLDLGALPSESVEELLAQVLGGLIDTAAAVDLGVRCRGNALFLRELVLGALQNGSLRDEGGIWRLVGPLAPSDRLVELIEARLGILDRAESGIIELLSYAEPLGRLEIETLAETDVVEALNRKGLVSSAFNDRRLEVRLEHPLYGDVIRTRIPPVRLVSLARLLAEVIEGVGARRREDTLRTATWRLVAGGGRADVLLSGARTARWRYDFPLAERLARAAVEAGGGFDAELLAAQTASLAGTDGDLDDALGSLAARAATDIQRCQVAHARLDRAVGAGNVEEARQVAATASVSITDPIGRDEITARSAWVEHVVDGPRAGAAASVPLLGRVTGKALVWAAVAASDGLARLGQVEVALDAADRGHQAYRTLPDRFDWYPRVFEVIRCEILTAGGALRDAEGLARAEYQRALDERSPEDQAIYAWVLGRVLRERGHLAKAIHLDREAIALSRQLRRAIHERDGLVDLAFALALTGAARAAEGILAQVKHQNLRLDGYRVVDPLQAQGWAIAATGNLPAAREILGAAADAGEARGDLIGASQALHGIARLGEPKRVVSRLADLAGSMEGAMVRAQLAHAGSLAASDAPQLETASGAFEDLGADLLAAEAAADAAVAWRKADDRRARAAAFRAARLAEGCEGASTPALQNLEARTHLTRAERDVALLAAGRQTNKEIAAKLGISVRTVESQLQRAYEKLGVSSRDELGPIVGARLASSDQENPSARSGNRRRPFSRFSSATRQ